MNTEEARLAPVGEHVCLYLAFKVKTQSHFGHWCFLFLCSYSCLDRDNGLLNALLNNKQ